MGGFLDELPEDMLQWIQEQKVFFLASAPLAGQGHVNVSPRGHECLYFPKEYNRKSCYIVDMTGSGNETISHCYEPNNARVTVMFNAFDGPPRILRLYTKGRIFEKGSKRFEELATQDKLLPGTRCVIWLDIHKVGYSCGMTVPFFDYVGERLALQDWARKKEQADEEGSYKNGIEAYWASKNLESVDGLPGLKLGYRNALKGIGGVTLDHDRTSYRIQQMAQPAQQSFDFWKGLLCGILLALVCSRVAYFARGTERWQSYSNI